VLCLHGWFYARLSHMKTISSSINNSSPESKDNTSHHHTLVDKLKERINLVHEGDEEKYRKRREEQGKLFDRVISDISYKEYIDNNSEEGENRWENVLELKRLAEEFSTRTMDEFLENIALVSDQDTIAEGNVPTLLTLHAAKGLEFGAVFIVGLDDGILPHSRSFDEPEQMEEERRLFYVGITRAKDKLYLVRSIQRGGRGSFEETYPSRFMDDVPADLIAGRTRTGRAPSFRTTRESSSETKWSLHNKPTTASVIESKFRAGTRIKHPTWGEGIILDSKIQDDDEIVDVVFNSVGIKRLSASLANLKIL